MSEPNTVIYYTDENGVKWRFEGMGAWQQLEIPEQPAELELQLHSKPYGLLAHSQVKQDG